MKFQVIFRDQSDEFGTREYGEDSSFTIESNGVLVTDEGGKRLHYSPAFWCTVSETTPTPQVW